MKESAIELIEKDFGSSFTIRKFDNTHQNSAPRWHSHPELELVYLSEGSGKRHIGQHMSQYDDGDLILIGPNLPHYGFTDRFSSNKSEIVLQFREDFLGPGLFDAVEFQAVSQLLKHSLGGLSYYGNVKDEIGERLESMFYMTPFEKMIELLKVLNIMATSREVVMLQAQMDVAMVASKGKDRLDTIFDYVRQNFQEEITLEEMSSLTHMTVPSFCRFFKTHTSKTFIEYLQQYRITHACKLLVESDMSITDVCYESGFNNFSHFNKIFKRITRKNPSDYKKDALLSIARL